MRNIEKKVLDHRKLFFAAAICGFMLLYLLSHLHHYLFNTFTNSLAYECFILLLLGAYYAKRGFRDGKEVVILTVYWLWVVFTRMLNGDLFLVETRAMMITFSLMILCFLPGLVLQGKKMETLYDWFAAFSIVFCFLLGMLGIYIGMVHVELVSPLDEYVTHLVTVNWRLYILGMGPNEAAGYWLTSFCFLIVMFFRHRNRTLRVLLGLAAVVDIYGIALTASRTVELLTGFVLAMAISIAFLQKFHKKKLLFRILIVTLSFLALIPLCYLMFEPVRQSMWAVYDLQPKEPVEEIVIEHPEEFTEDELLELGGYKGDERDVFSDTGRLTIWKYALLSLKKEPRRLLVGCEYWDVMKYFNEAYPKTAPTFHNFLLQVINYTGIIGLLLTIAFCLLILKKGFTIALESEGRYRMDEKMLIIPITAQLGFHMMEAGIFTFTDYRILVFYFSCGVLLGLQKKKNDTEL